MKIEHDSRHPGGMIMHSKMTARIADGQESDLEKRLTLRRHLRFDLFPRSSLRHPSLLAGRPLLSYRVCLQRYQN